MVREIRRTHLKDRVVWAPSQVVMIAGFLSSHPEYHLSSPCFQGGAWHWAPGRHNPSFWLMNIFWVLETLVGGFIFKKNHPYLGKCSNLTNNFSNGLKPPTRKHLFGFLSSIRLPHFLDFFSGASSGETRKFASLWHFGCHKPSAGHAARYWYDQICSLSQNFRLNGGAPSETCRLWLGGSGAGTWGSMKIQTWRRFVV